MPDALEVSQNPFMPNLPNRCGKMTKPGDLGIMDDGEYVRRKCGRIFRVTQVLILMTCKVMYTEKVILTRQQTTSDMLSIGLNVSGRTSSTIKLSRK